MENTIALDVMGGLMLLLAAAMAIVFLVPVLRDKLLYQYAKMTNSMAEMQHDIEAAQAGSTNKESATFKQMLEQRVAELEAQQKKDKK